MKKRCPWCRDNPLYVAYHDEEWGRAVHDERTLFEFIVLEGMQAGLSWLTVLKKRENFRRAFVDFDPEKVARFTSEDVAILVEDAGIIRHSKKIHSAINNAKAFLKIQDQFSSFDNYIWSFVEGQPIQNAWECVEQVPSSSSISEQMAKDLKTKGFSFVGTKICYSFMQATGMVNDHLTSCFRH